MKYEEYLKKTSFTKEELVASSWGTLVEDAPPDGVSPLPSPPFLMFDRIVEIKHEGSKGRIVAEQDIHMDAWFFQCHFRLDPVQPGCLGVDAVWQLIGYYITLRGATGSGRALGAKEVEFSGQIRPYNKIVRYEIDIRRYVELPAADAAMAIGNAVVLVDGEEVYTIKDAKVGVFKGIRYPDYPHRSVNSIGGRLER